MAELVLVITSKVQPDANLNWLCYKRGDVIEVRENGWPWSERERTNPDWRIIKCPNLSVDFLADLLAGQREPDGKLLIRRARYLAIDTLPNNALKKIENATAPITFTGTEEQVLVALKTTKPGRQVQVG